MTHPLLTPRYMVEADYPNSPYEVGQIIDFSEPAEFKSGNVVGADLPETFYNKYPNIFRPMHWSEQRKVGEMPRYVNRKGVIKKVLDPKYDNRIFGHNEHEIEMRTLLHGIRYWKESYTPATEAEYLEYLKSKNNESI